ncbi:LacI family DNA-binding transcriptional regulator [Bacillus sp. JJ722]|uniref:LacI family DNA-binding transcriptional regulator n=1 Tax=Bacillus sp. JJ722 TaxID=3122973 RepID=UPI002FFFC196
MATIRDVAKAAGVSVATVSRVLNETGYVHEDTRKKVEGAIQELDYSPNEVARSLFRKESRLIGLLLPDITNPFFPELARGVEDEIQKHGFHLLFGNSDEKSEKEQEYIQTFVKNNVVGFISATNAAGKANYQDLQIPTVFLDRGSKQEYSIYADGREGGRIAAQELIKRNSKRITILKGPAHVEPAQERFLGSIEVLSQSNVDFNVMSTTSFSFKDAQVWAKEIFQKYSDTDGVIASNDVTATAVLHEALQLGKKIPDDLQIIGFDDIPLCQFVFPSLSTIRQPAYEMGKTAAALLIQLIKKQQVDKQSIRLPVTFIERNTTRKVIEHG